MRLKFINLEIKNIITNIMLSNEFTGVAICILILVFVSYFVVKISNNRKNRLV